MYKPLKKLMVAAAITGLSLLSVSSQVFAQSNGLGVTPKQSFTMNAGEQASNSLFLSNLNKTQPLTVKITVVDFEAANESGTAKLLKATSQPETPWSLKPYISLPDTVTVPAGSQKQVPFTIKLPANVGAGTYYSAVEYTASTGTNQQQVSIAASTATLLFINVPGKVSELLTLKDFGFTGDSKPTTGYSSLFKQQPEYFAYRLANSGNVAEIPAGSIIIKNVFGKTVAHVDSANPLSQLALIGQTRKFTGCNVKDTSPEKIALPSNCTPLHLSPGFYTATLALLYGQNGQPTRQIGATAHFWYMPTGVLVVLLIVLAVIAWLVYKLYHRIKRR